MCADYILSGGIMVVRAPGGYQLRLFKCRTFSKFLCTMHKQ